MSSTKRIQTLIKSQNELNSIIFNAKQINEKKLIELATNVFNTIKSKLIFKIKRCNNEYCPYYHIVANNRFYYKIASLLQLDLHWAGYIIKTIEHINYYDRATDKVIIEKEFPSDICINFNYIRERTKNIYSVSPIKSIRIRIIFRKTETNSNSYNSIDFEISIAISKKKVHEYVLYFDISNQKLNVYGNSKDYLNEEPIIFIAKNTFEELLTIPDKIFHQKPVYAKLV